MNLRTGPGMPAGPSLRTASHIVTLVVTEEPHPPRLQPNEVQLVPRKVGLIVTPIAGGAARDPIEIARKVPPSSNPDAIRLLGVDGEQVWIRAGKIYTYDLRTGEVDEASSSAPRFASPSVSDAVTSGALLTPTDWLGMHRPDDVESGRLKPGSPVMPNLFPLRHLPFEPLRDSKIPERDGRRLYHGRIDPSGPIPRFASMDAVDSTVYRNGVVLTESKGQPLILKDPDSLLIAHEGKFPEITLQVHRVTLEGKLLWTADTRINRDLEILPGRDVIAFRGAPQVPSGKFPQPVLVLLNPRTGEIQSRELRWP
jgi:hypothetical protein